MNLKIDLQKLKDIKSLLPLPDFGQLGLKTLVAKESSVVVEIGNDWLKIVESRRSPKGSTIEKLILKRIVDIHEPVPVAIANIFKDMKITRQSVIVSIPRHLITLRIIDFPSVDAAEIRDMVELQVGKQTPYSREEIFSSHHIIDDPDRQGYSKVMVVIARKNIIDSRVEALQKAGLEIERVVVSSEGLYHWFTLAHGNELKVSNTEIFSGKDAHSKAFVIVDVDSNYTDFLLIYKGEMVYTRNVLIGAEQLKDEERWRERLGEDAAQTIGFYQNQEQQARFAKVFLCGAANYIPGIAEGLQERLRLPVLTTDVAQGIRISKSIVELGQSDYQMLSLSTVLGLALQEGRPRIDLTSEDLRIQKRMDVQRRQLTLTGVLFASVVMMASACVLSYINNKSVYYKQLKVRSNSIEKESQVIERMRMTSDLVEGRLDATKQSINVLREVARLTPQPIYYTNVTIEDKKNVVLQGNAKAMSDVFEFVTTLEGSEYFENVKTTYTTTKKEKGIEVAKFEIICMYERGFDELE